MSKLNKKGQALIEFLLILPVFLLILFAIIDFGQIFLEKNNLENLANEAVKAYGEDKNYDYVNNYLNSLTDKDFELTLDRNDASTVLIKIQRDVNIITPGLQKVLGSNFKASSERVVIDEE